MSFGCEARLNFGATSADPQAPPVPLRRLAVTPGTVVKLHTIPADGLGSLMQITVSADNFFSALRVLSYIFIRSTSERRSIFQNANSRGISFTITWGSSCLPRGGLKVMISFPASRTDRPTNHPTPSCHATHASTQNLSGSSCHSR
ncbi:hypothetical protein E2C01_036421 [Portunus trituberculatus]|uniref:Uncharacterized protein n=1 Tax=Portunus trituberculatus TaxID=210409 RepID=A0A5B7F5P5_PORTR|nr:hypothetical protein [Portunus trituberculatus]